MSRELHNLESYIKKESLKFELFKLNQVSLSSQQYLKGVKDIRKIVLLKESLVQEVKPSILTSIFNTYWI